MTEASDPIPATTLPVSAQAPGKCILFGEHAVVHGAPELLFALDLSTQVVVAPAASTRLNGDADALGRNAYFRTALEQGWAGRSPLEVRAVSRIPQAAGLGSSAAFAAALTACLGAATGGIDRPRLAQRSFDVERGAQGVGSPGDTTAAVGGGFLTINHGEGDPLWEVTDGTHRWTARRVTDPGWVWVVAHSGIPRSTGDAVRAVGARLARADGPKLLEEFTAVARDGIRAVAREDRGDVARLMDRNHELLREVGVSHPRLEALLAAARPAIEGGKLTGAGAGGSLVVLPRAGHETEAVRRLARAGALPFAVRPSPRGTELVDAPRPTA